MRKNINLQIFNKIKNEQVELNDWPVFIETLRYILFPMISGMFQREDPLNSHCAYFGKFKYVPSLKDNFFSVIKSGMTPFSKRSIVKYRRGGKKVLYCRPDNRFIETLRLHVSSNSYFLVTDRIDGTRGNLFFAPCNEMAKDSFGSRLYFDCLLRILGKYGIWLNEAGVRRISLFSLLAIQSIERTRRFFSLYPIDALVVDGDSWLPINAFVQIAREFSIPVMCIQHGLDCEHWCLDEAFSQYYCVWGLERKNRYLEKSIFQPSGVFVTGNPLFDSFRLPEGISAGGASWLLLTRPHVPEKCYESSRYPEEGADVLKRILVVMEKIPESSLVIRLHPKDDIQRYLDVLNDFGCASRVSVASIGSSLYENIRNADVVFTEDSTSGMEAMLFGKPIIHLSACKAGPVLPFIDYGAAFSGLSQESVEASATRLFKGMSKIEKVAMLRGQQNFLNDFCGVFDGKAAQRVGMAIMEVFL